MLVLICGVPITQCPILIFISLLTKVRQLVGEVAYIVEEELENLHFHEGNALKY